MIRNIPQLITAGCSFQSAYFFSLSLSQADLSRFGRNYIEAGNYLEHVFPAMGVRFISIGDGYDSAEKIGGRQQCRHCPLAEQFRDFVPLLLPVPERHPDRPAVRPAQAL